MGTVPFHSQLQCGKKVDSASSMKAVPKLLLVTAISVKCIVILIVDTYFLVTSFSVRVQLSIE